MNKRKNIMNKKTVIFDLDGTLANIDVRRDKSTKPNGKVRLGFIRSSYIHYGLGYTKPSSH